jgi:hypothetical protein
MNTNLIPRFINVTDNIATIRAVAVATPSMIRKGEGRLIPVLDIYEGMDSAQLHLFEQVRSTAYCEAVTKEELADNGIFIIPQKEIKEMEFKEVLTILENFARHNDAKQDIGGIKMHTINFISACDAIQRLYGLKDGDQKVNVIINYLMYAGKLCYVCCHDELTSFFAF